MLFLVVPGCVRRPDSDRVGILCIKIPDTGNGDEKKSSSLYFYLHFSCGFVS